MLWSHHVNHHRQFFQHPVGQVPPYPSLKNMMEPRLKSNGHAVLELPLTDTLPSQAFNYLSNNNKLVEEILEKKFQVCI